IAGAFKFITASFVQLAVPFSSVGRTIEAANSYPPVLLWALLFLTGVWLYLNFSGVSDVFIGVGRVVGYRVPENFDNPFAATDITDFWRRWHISLGNWLRIVIFNPMARTLGKWLPSDSILIATTSAIFTMFVCGLWHQTSRTYIYWGLLHGVALAAHQVWSRYGRKFVPADIQKAKAYIVAAWLVTHAWVTFSWVFFFPLQGPFDVHMLALRRLFSLH
ncbi:MAG: MBOAT family O-acyltransferase, partial [Xanthobacteraceae bacterium]